MKCEINYVHITDRLKPLPLLHEIENVKIGKRDLTPLYILKLA